ncbi:MAG TPA: AbrB/MazE/SpoVT family DNA-binding domain-containing protein [Candidatus Korarchaeota archaeon]|nr:AbrB/MazE/SpoVT family DNA-binding domain-containing protein [Candidatus Korarchaeota archaeon]
MMSDIKVTIRVGRRRALYIPAEVARRMDIEEGDLLVLQVKGDSIILRPAARLLKIREKWAKTSIEEFEAESEIMTREMEDEQAQTSA